MSEFWIQSLATVVKALAVFAGLMGGVSIMTWIERRLSGVIQFRWGPNRVGPLGLFQPVADGIKFIMKEETIPAEADKSIFVLAPLLSLVAALCAFIAIPFGPNVRILGHTIGLSIIDTNAGLLFVFAAGSLGVYGIVLAGWASMNKYALMGGLRSSAQMISYELSLALSTVGVLLVSGTLNLQRIVEQQSGWFWHWNFFGGGQFFGFLLFVIAGFAETNRLPFDMPEAESELVAGYHTEYSSMKFAMFFMAEYINMMTSSSVAVTLFLGGWQLGFPTPGLEGWPLWILQLLAFVAKVGFFQVLFVWVRWTLPRMRYDQVMHLGWKNLFPLSLVNLAATAAFVAIR